MDETSVANESDPTILDKLRKQFGVGVDPHISLVPEPDEREEERESAREPLSGVLKRIGSRGLPATRYRVKGEIARGGMGAILEVWDEDLRRRLAMKVALSARDEIPRPTPRELDPRVLARFLEEAQITGQLDHPGIIPVHELGLDAEGGVFFTMRLVQGRDLEHIFGLVAREEEDWSETRALGVLLKACEAMAYAHDKGVIHRDLKPANLMVGRFGEVYVMDWGLARVSGHEDRHDLRISVERSAEELPLEVDRREDASGGSSANLYTIDGDVIGTPAYMSPEQARGELDVIEARSDVYAMGALLYRLLTGRPPYVPKGEKRGAYQILKDLRAGAPTPVEELAPNVPGELVAICEKAMAREPERRYANMLELAIDLRSYLENRVVRAYETGALAETRKWVRRNKPLALAVAAGILALAGGLAASLVLKQQSDDNAALAELNRGEAVAAAGLAEERRIQADRSAEEARRQARINEEVNRFLNDDLLGAVAPEMLGWDVTVREVLDEASVRLEGRFADEPTIEAELRTTIGKSYEHLGEYALALPHFERALELHREERGAVDERTLDSMHAIASVLDSLGRAEEAHELLERTVELAREVFGEEDVQTLRLQTTQVTTLAALSRLEEARELGERTAEILRRVEGPRSPETLTGLNNLAVIYQDLGRFEEAEAILREVLEARQAIHGPRHPETLTVSSNLALTLEEQGRYDEALALYLSTIDVRREVDGPDHPGLGVELNNLGVLYVHLGRLPEAEEALLEAVAQLRRVLGEEHHETLNALNSLATLYYNQERLDECLAIREPILEAHRRVRGPKDLKTLSMMNNLANLYLDLDRFEEAIALFEETIALCEEHLGSGHPQTLLTLENLSGVYFRMEDYEKCLEILPMVLEGRREALGENHPDVMKTLYNLAMVESETGNLEGAIEAFRGVLAGNRATLGEVHPNTADTLKQLGNLLLDTKEYALAAERYGEALAIRRQLGPDDPTIGYLLHQVGYSQYRLRDYDAALATLREGLELRRELLGPQDDTTLVTLFLTANALRRVKQFEEAETLAIEYHEGLLLHGGEAHRDYGYARRLFRELYTDWGRPEDAEAWAD